MVELTQAQANIIFETIIVCQEYDFTPQFGHELRLIKNELEASYQSFQKAKTELVKKHKGAYKGDKIDFGTSKNRGLYMDEEKELSEVAREYNVNILPLELIFKQEKLPGKFMFNLDPIIAKKI